MPMRPPAGTATAAARAATIPKEGTSPSAVHDIAVHHAQVLSGWPLELVANVAAAPDRAVAAALIELSRDAIDALPEPRRELLLTHLQDIIAQLPFCGRRRR